MERHRTRYSGRIPLILCKKILRDKKDKFETLCYVEADLSTAPYKSKLMKTEMCYRCKYEVILLVGLTELKAQISWIDSETARPHVLLHPVRIYLTIVLCANLGCGEKVCSTVFRISLP